MKITVQANSGEFSFECDAGERVLYAGLSQGLRLPYECATGTCGTCRGRVVQGSTLVEWDEAPGFARLKRAKGDVLMCQARPTTDCVLRVPANLGADPDSPTLPLHRRGTIKQVRKLVRDVIEIDVTLSRPVTFDAGQFVVLEVPGLKGGRAYSMVNYRRDSDRLTFVIKLKPGGGFSDWLFGSEVGGAEVNVFGPLGAATFRPAEGRNILCIAGGSGIAGMLSILEHAGSENYFRDHSGHVFFGVRGLADGFYLQELSHYVAAAQGKLQVTLALSHEEAAGATHPQFPHIRLASGMVTDVMTREMGGQYDGTVSFIAGPTPMVDEALRILIRVARQPAAFVRYDKYT
jgi:toluene monooxygenase electron transfer component